MAGWGSTTSLNAMQRDPSIQDEIELFQFPAREWVSLRLYGPVYSVAQAVGKVRKKDGTETKEFPLAVCLDYDGQKHEMVREICPYRAGGMKIRQKFIALAIIRDIQDNPPRKKPEPLASEQVRQVMLGRKFYIKDPKSKTFSPSKAIMVPSSVAEEIKNLADLNKHKNPKTGKKESYDVSDDEFGCDINIKFNPDSKTPNGFWSVQKGDVSPLTSEEKKYLVPQLVVPSTLPKNLKDAKKNWESLRERLIFSDKKEDEEEGNTKNKNNKKVNYEDDDDAPTPKNKSSKKLKNKREEKVKTKTKTKNKKRRSIDSIDEFELD